MNQDIQAGMAEATRLTQAGRLSEATALIQRLLGGGQGPAAYQAAGDLPALTDGKVIDVDPVEVHDEPAATSAPGKRRTAKAAGFAGRMGDGPRKGLGETLRDLAAKAGAMGGAMGPAARPAAEPLPEGASFLSKSFTNRAGTRAYKLYVPGSHAGKGLPLVVMLHGCTQNPDDFAAGTGMNALAEELGFLVAYPEQPQSANAQRCWNWFNAADQKADRGEPSLLAGIARQVVRDHGADPARVYAAGLSAGGAAAAILGAAYPDLFAAVGVHSGLPVGAAHDMPSAFAAMRQGTGAKPGKVLKVPTIVLHGDQDHTVNAVNGEGIVAQCLGPARRPPPTVRQGRVPGGHGYTVASHADATGTVLCEHWTIHSAGHAWAGGSRSGSYTDPKGPDATREMVRFFLSHRRAGAA